MNSRKHNRWYTFDYTSNAKYFITICSHNREHCFGEIVDNNVVYNDLGTIVDKQINWLSNQYPYLLIHNAIVMPNHVHLLMEIVGNKLSLDELPDVGDDWRVVGTGRDLSVLKNMDSRDNVDRSRPVPTLKIKSISELIGAFKTTSSKLIHETGKTDFKWQRSFHDHVIRNQVSYNQIYSYISKNPESWDNDVLR